MKAGRVYVRTGSHSQPISGWARATWSSSSEISAHPACFLCVRAGALMEGAKGLWGSDMTKINHR